MASTGTAKSDTDPLHRLRLAVRARPEGRPSQGRSTRSPGVAATRGDVVARPGRPGCGSVDGGGLRNKERIALAVAVLVDERTTLAASRLDSLPKTRGVTHFRLYANTTNAKIPLVCRLIILVSSQKTVTRQMANSSPANVGEVVVTTAN